MKHMLEESQIPQFGPQELEMWLLKIAKVMEPKFMVISRIIPANPLAPE